VRPHWWTNPNQRGLKHLRAHTHARTFPYTRSHMHHRGQMEWIGPSHSTSPHRSVPFSTKTMVFCIAQESGVALADMQSSHTSAKHVHLQSTFLIRAASTACSALLPLLCSALLPLLLLCSCVHLQARPYAKHAPICKHVHMQSTPHLQSTFLSRPLLLLCCRCCCSAAASACSTACSALLPLLLLCCLFCCSAPVSICKHVHMQKHAHLQSSHQSTTASVPGTTR
jgi:hypothetical protein